MSVYDPRDVTKTRMGPEKVSLRIIYIWILQYIKSFNLIHTKIVNKNSFIQNIGYQPVVRDCVRREKNVYFLKYFLLRLCDSSFCHYVHVHKYIYLFTF